MKVISSNLAVLPNAPEIHIKIRGPNPVTILLLVSVSVVIRVIVDYC